MRLHDIPFRDRLSECTKYRTNYQVAKINHFTFACLLVSLAVTNEFFFSPSRLFFAFVFRSLENNYFNKCLLRFIRCVCIYTFSSCWTHFVLLKRRRLLNCFVRWNEFQVFNDHVISIHKYSMTFSHKLSIKLNRNAIKKSIKESNFICFLCTFCELYGWNQQCSKFIYSELTPLLMTIIRISHFCNSVLFYGITQRPRNFLVS